MVLEKAHYLIVLMEFINLKKDKYYLKEKF